MPDQFRLVNVPTVGQVQFPSEMSDDDVAAAIQKNYPQLGGPQKDPLEMQRQHPAGLGDMPLPGVPKAPDPIAAIPSQQKMGDLLKEQWHEGFNIFSRPARDRADAARKEYNEAQEARGGTDRVAQAVELGKSTYEQNADRPLIWELMDRIAQNTSANQNDTEPYFTKDFPAALATNRNAPGTLSPEDSKAIKRVKGVARAGYNATGQLSTPENLAIGTALLAKPEATASKLAVDLFTGQSFIGAKDEFKAAREAKDTDERWEHGAMSGLDAFFGLLGARHIGETFHESAPAKSATEVAPLLSTDQLRPNTEDVSSASPVSAKTVLSSPDKPVTTELSSVASNGAVPSSPAVSAGTTAAPRSPVSKEAVGKLDTYTGPVNTPQPQAQNPSEVSDALALEKTLKGTVSKYLRMRQLHAAAEQRMGLDRALDSVGRKGAARNSRPIVPDKPFEQLSTTDQQTVKSVAAALSLGEDKPVTAADLEARHYQLLEPTKDNPKFPDELAKLESVYKAGLHVQDASDYFGVQAIHPFSRVVKETAKAAGVPGYDNLAAQVPKSGATSSRVQQKPLFDDDAMNHAAVMVGKVLGLSPEDATDLISSGNATRDQIGKLRAAAAAGTIKPSDLQVLSKKTSTTPTAEEAMAGGVDVTGRQGAEGTGKGTTVGADLSQLEARHAAMQRVLARRIRETKDAIVDAIPAWRQARIGATEPSELATQINALSGNTKKALPKELYAEEHLRPASSEGTPSPQSVQPLPIPEAATTAKGTEASVKPAEQQGASASSGDIEKKIDLLMQYIHKTYGEEAMGAFPKLYDAVAEKYKDPDNVNTMFFRMAKKYADSLKEKTPNALDNVISTLKGYPAEKGPSSVSLNANPIGPVIDKLFGTNRKPVMEPFPNLTGTLPDQPIRNFTDSLKQQPEASHLDQFKAYWANETNNFVNTWREMPGNLNEKREALSNWFQKVITAYKERPGLNAVDLAMGLRNLHLNQASYELQDFVDTMNKRHPDGQRRAAMSAWMEAGGGRLPDANVDELVANQSHDFAGTSELDPTHKKFFQIYDAAAHLTDEEKQTVRDYRAYLSKMEERERAAGLDHDVELDYLQHIWSRDNFVQNSLKAIQSGRGFGTTANFARMRKFDSYFEGIQKGYKPNSLDMTYLVSSRAMSSARVLANRELVNFLKDYTMPDGSKAVVTEGIGTHQEPNPSEADKRGAILVKSIPGKEGITPGGEPYIAIDHSAFQNWKWVGKADDGTEILYRGSMRAHPEIAKQLQRILYPSKVPDFKPLGIPVGKAALKVSSIGKQTLLIGLFHPVQLGVHMLEHAGVGAITNSTSSATLRSLNPFSTEKFVDLSDPVQQQLVVHGLQLRMFDAESQMDEGVMSKGLVNGAPYMGGLWRGMHDAIFQKMIPNMKMSLAQDILKRNMSRYHDRFKAEELKKAGFDNGATAPQGLQAQASIAAQSRIYRLTAEQTNAAFGGIDWSKMPVSKTTQDVLRLLVLAPDFLLARAQFVGDAFRPGGAESRNALGAGFALQYMMARAVNYQLNDGDAKWDIHDWNKIVYKHHSYSLRTVQGDTMDAILDSRRFVEHRVNPLWRPAIEAYTQKDVWGHPVTPGQMLVDAVENITPMPLQGGTDWAASKLDPNLRAPKNADSFADSFAQSMVGIMRQQYRTPAERLVFNDFDAIKGPPTSDELAMEQKNQFIRLRDAYRAGTLKPDMLTKALNDPKANLKSSEVAYIFKTANKTELVNRAQYLQYNQVHSAWEVASPPEKAQLAPILWHKVHTLPFAQQRAAYAELAQYNESLTPEQREKYRAAQKEQIEWEQSKK